MTTPQTFRGQPIEAVREHMRAVARWLSLRGTVRPGNAKHDTAVTEPIRAERIEAGSR